MFRMFAIALALLAAVTLVWAEEPAPVAPPTFDWTTKSFDLPRLFNAMR